MLAGILIYRWTIHIILFNLQNEGVIIELGSRERDFMTSNLSRPTRGGTRPRSENSSGGGVRPDTSKIPRKTQMQVFRHIAEIFNFRDRNPAQNFEAVLLCFHNSVHFFSENCFPPQAPKAPRSLPCQDLGEVWGANQHVGVNICPKVSFWAPSAPGWKHFRKKWPWMLESDFEI